MRKDIKAAWIKDLRTTDARQAMGALKERLSEDEVGYCCLGRLCVVVRDQFPEILEQIGVAVDEGEGSIMVSTPGWDDGDYLVDGTDDAQCSEDNESSGTLVLRLVEALGLPSIDVAIVPPEGSAFDWCYAKSLVDLNDEAGFTFGQVADVIEAQL